MGANKSRVNVPSNYCFCVECDRFMIRRHIYHCDQCNKCVLKYYPHCHDCGQYLPACKCPDVKLIPGDINIPTHNVDQSQRKSSTHPSRRGP